MPHFPDLDRMLEEATFFPGLNVRLSALQKLEQISEEQLDLARKLAIARVRLEHAQSGSELHPEDRAFDLGALEQQVTHLLPKLTRGGLLLTAWSVFERSVKDIAFRAASHVGRPLNGTHFRSKNLLAALEQALSPLIPSPVYPEQHELLSLQLLAAVRNVLIHHDGRIEEAGSTIVTLKPSELEALGLRAERDYDYEYLVPEAEYVAASVALVYSFTHDLASRVFNALVPASPPEV